MVIMASMTRDTGIWTRSHLKWPLPHTSLSLLASVYHTSDYAYCISKNPATMDLKAFPSYLDRPDILKSDREGHPAPGSKLEKYLEACTRHKHRPIIEIYDAWASTNLILRGHRPADDLARFLEPFIEELTTTQNEGFVPYKALPNLDDSKADFPTWFGDPLMRIT